MSTDPTPQALGFAMPAEWATHAATWMSWPADNELWFGHLFDVRNEFTDLIHTIAHFEPVHLLVRDEESEADAKARLTDGHVTFHRVPLDDVWIRDNGPLFLTREGPVTELSFINWKFNAWGGKFHWQNDNQVPEYIGNHLHIKYWSMPQVLEGGGLEVNGAGVGLTTRSCFLTDTRNAGMTEQDYAQLLHSTLGIEHLLWLDGGLENDHTDGHIDTITRFTDSKTIVTSIETNPKDPNHIVMSNNLDKLKQMTDQHGQHFEIIELPLPANYLEGAEGRLPPTYANFYIGNGFVVVPQYNDPNDAEAIEILKPLFPNRQVIGLNSRKIIEGGGSFHCITQQQPVGKVWRGE